MQLDIEGKVKVYPVHAKRA